MVTQKIINDPWFKNLLFDITIYCRLHLQQIDERRIMELQSFILSIYFSEKYIPQSLRLRHMFFTQLIIVGDFVQYQNEIVSYFD